MVESPVVYYADVAPEVRNHLRAPALVEDVERLTGLRVERRSEGLVLVDTVGLTDQRFPGTGAVAQTALLLLGEIADRAVDPDSAPLPRMAAPSAAERLSELTATIDAGLPAAGLLATLAGFDPDDGDIADGEPGDRESGDRESGPGGPGASAGPDSTTYPFLPDAFLRTTTAQLIQRYGKALGERWRVDPDRLRSCAVELLAAHGLLQPVDGGVLVLPLSGRYRDVVATVRKRRTATPSTLFDVTEEPAQ